jgi:hypothetical protein
MTDLNDEPEKPDFDENVCELFIPGDGGPHIVRWPADATIKVTYRRCFDPNHKARSSRPPLTE